MSSLMLAVIVAAVFLGPGLNYGPTPQAAAISMFARFAGATDRHVTIVRTNVVGRFATVHVRGALIEGTPIDEPLLFERFPFGWQAVEIANFRCRIRARGITAAQADRLMRGMLDPKDDGGCAGTNNDIDVGPAADVIALRRRERALFVPTVRVAGNFARVAWYGGGGGEHYYRRDGKGWRFIAGGGGAYGPDDMPKLGIPRADWCKLGIYDAPCRSTK